MSYLAAAGGYPSDLGATVTVTHRTSSGKPIKPSTSKDHRAATTAAATTAVAAPAGGVSKLVLFAGLGAAVLVGVVLLKKRKKGSSSPTIALFSAPKVS